MNIQFPLFPVFEKRLKTERDTKIKIQAGQKNDKATELDKQILADLPELEKNVAESKKKKNKYDNFVSIGMKNWLVG